ncbi:putative membrane protein [Nitrosospira multiformis]|uniref:Putative membrane protein n=1 Tax=Nitrosospira multiformis TaxID=1231 RepID=A0A2T5IA62_9PROT|nr:FimV/HubP family polar landmark protein [Nitrosospira multiformis]PTQ80712.1 putative membrane protein [Nitrosospira multiformis]
MSVEASHAAGLGRLTVNSVQGQPFQAEIDLVTVTTEEKSSLNAHLASHDVFRKVNVDYSPLLSTFRTTIEIHPDGQPYIRIVSPQPVDEPFLNILIELNWASGRLLREYTALLPLAETGALSRENESAQPPSHCYPADGKTDPAIAHDSVSSGQARLLPGATASNPSYRTYGPVKPGDTLSGIAKNIALPPEASFNQALVALFHANREAFTDNNMHQLKAGFVLRIPDSSEINMITIGEANQEVRMHTAEWHRKQSSKTEEREKEWGPLPWALVL